MDISAIPALPTTTTTTTSSSSGISLNDFYKLLAAEMQYQDPSGDSSSGGSSDSSSYITELATLSEATAVQNLTAVQNSAMALGMTGKSVAYTSTSTAADGVVTSTAKTGTVEAVDFSTSTPMCYVATTTKGTTTGSWVNYTAISQVYASDVTDSTASSGTTV
jgi:flagellar hook assembly protein FlgD